MEIEIFEGLYRKYYPRILEYCLAKLSYDMNSAVDAADDTFITLYNKWDKLEISNNIKLWLYRTADNHIKKCLRKRKHYYERIDPCDDFEELENMVGMSYNDRYFETNVPEEELICRVKDSLPAEYRELFFLRYERKLTFEEISKSLASSYSTTRRKIIKMDLEIQKAVSKMFENNI